MNQEETKVKEIVSILEDKKGRSIVVLDVQQVSMMSDFIILCSGTSKTHIKALYQYIHNYVKEKGYDTYSIEGLADSSWILIDLGFCVVHILNEELREYYDLENLWNQAERSESIKAQ